MANPKNNQLAALLDKFYYNPVAVVSFELFLSIGAIIFFAVFAIRPTLATMSNLIKEIEDKRKLDTQFSQKVSALNLAQKNFSSLQDQLYVLDEAIPRGVEMSHTLKIVEKAASDQNLVITNLTILKIPQDPPSDAQIGELEKQSMPIQLTVSGSYESIRDFTNQLQDSRRSFTIDRLVFTTKDIRGQRSLEAVLMLGAPYFGIKTK
ncbi:MAG: type 4a pilus biogenesis protein PilO [Candidatus Paceibacterota bacterium]